MRPVPLEPPDWRVGEVEAGPAARVLLLNSRRTTPPGACSTTASSNGWPGCAASAT